MKVVPFIQTIGCEKYKIFLSQPFNVEMLYPVNGEKTIETLFSGWKGKNMGTWNKFTNEENIVLEFYPTQYILVFPKGVKYTLPLPETLNSFINDMLRFGVQLFWGEYMDKNFEPKEYFHQDEIRAYFADLLNRMGKSHELI